MRNRLIIVLFALCLLVVGCEKGRQINASSNKTLYRSVTMIAGGLSEEQRVPYEVAFWSLKQSEPDPAAFRNSVDGQNVEEIIAMGKADFIKRKAAGEEGYQQYASWDEMIDELVAERQRIRVYGKNAKDDQNQIQFNR